MLGTDRVAVAARSAGLVLVLACGLAVNAHEVERRGVIAKDVKHSAICTQCAHGEGLPAYDIRVDDAVYGAVASASAQIAAERALGAAGKLRGAVPGLAVDFDESLGTPKFVRSTEGFLTGQRREAAWSTVIGDFVTANRGLMEFDAAELTGNRVTRDFVTRHNGVRSVTVQQVHAGVDVFGATLRASVTKNGELINLSSTMLERPAAGFAPAETKVSAAQAVVLAAADAGVKVGAEELAVDEAAEGAEQRTVWKTPAALRSDEALVTKLVYFPLTRDTIVPAWAVVVAQHGLGHTYDTVIDATDGKVLHRVNRLVCAAPITMRVYTNDSPAPMSPGLSFSSTTQAPFVSRDLVTVTTEEMLPWSPLGWITDGTFETVGNNVDAHTDIDANNTADTPRPNGGASLTFDFPLDTTQAPSTYRDAAVIQMFYLTNRHHDRLYSLGFDEPAGNYQTNNFGLGGTGNDAVRADVQDGSGFNNANFTTSGADGSTGR